MGISTVINKGINLADDVARYVKACGKQSILQTKSLNCIKSTDLVYRPNSVIDDVFVSSKKLVDNDFTLFSWAQKQPEFSMTSIKPDSMVLVHMTDYFPKNGKIMSSYSATKASEGIGLARDTIHFSINKSVTEHSLGNSWNTMEYSIILPFKEVLNETPKSKVLGGLQEDFFFQESVKLPKGSVIVKYNPKIAEGKLLVSDVFDGVKLVETSTKKLNEATSTIINKMGYTTYPDAFKKFLGASDEEMLLLTSYPESHVQEAIELINKQGGTQKFRELLQERFVQSKELIGDMPEFKMVLEQHNEQLKMLEFIEKYSESLKVFPKAWDDFCSKEGFVTGLHSTTPWYKAEMAIFGVELIEKMHANSWGNGLKQILLQTIDNAEKSLPKGKAFGFDIKRLKMILEESSTPQIAKQRLADELRSKPMPPKDLYPEGVVLGEEAIIMNLNALLGEVF